MQIHDSMQHNYPELHALTAIIHNSPCGRLEAILPSSGERLQRTPQRLSAGGPAFEPSTLTLAADRAVISACFARFPGVLSCFCRALADSAVDFDFDRAGCACTRSLTQRQQRHGCRAWHGSVLRPIRPRAGQECMACALGPHGPGKPRERVDVRPS